MSTPQNNDVRDRASCRQCVMAWAEQKDSPLYKQQFVYGMFVFKFKNLVVLPYLNFITFSDGQHILYTPVALKKDGYDASVEFFDDSPRSREGKRDLRIDMKLVTGVDMNRLVKAINNETMVVPMECVQVQTFDRVLTLI